jgi:hypothetical protein
MKPAAPAIEQTQTVSIGAAPAPTTDPVATPAGPGTSDPTVQSEAERQLEELEKRLQGGTGS